MATYDEMRPTFPDRTHWTLPHVLRTRAATHGEHTYLDCPEEGVALTFAEVHEQAGRIATGLLDLAEPGDRVLVMAPNCAAYVLTWFGAALAGMVEVPINTAYLGDILAHQVRTADPAVAVVTPEHVERLLAIGEAGAGIRHVAVLPDPSAADPVGSAREVEGACRQLRDAGREAMAWDDLAADHVTPDLPDPAPRDPVGILFTSGTTGPSKGVVMSQAHMYFFADECVSLTRLTDADTYLVMGPLFHGNAQFLAAYPALIAGARFVLHSRFSATRWVQRIRDARATVTNFVGVMMDFVWKQPATDGDADNDLRCVFAAPTASYVDAFRARFGIEAFVEVFGLTETSMPIMSAYGQDRPPGAAGLVNADWFDVRLVDPETDEEVPVGAVGELVVRPKVPWITTLGYYGMPERTVEAFRNLWFHTGDGLRRDADGWYYFVDRLKDALRRRGENISSYEVESPLLAHPDIAECAVVAVPADHDAGEDEVMAVLVPAEGATIDLQGVWTWAAERIPDFAVPRYLRVVESLPMTPSGKVRKRELREEGVTPDTADRTRQPA